MGQRKEYKVRGGFEMAGKGEPWHTKEREYEVAYTTSEKNDSNDDSTYSEWHFALVLFQLITNRSRNQIS